MFACEILTYSTLGEAEALSAVAPAKRKLNFN